MRRWLRAFTVVELVFVIAILAILLFLLLPALARAREESRQKACKENCSQIGKAFSDYTQSANENWPFAWGPANGACSKVPDGTNTNMCDPGTSLACLYPSYVNTPNLFRCPSTEDQPSFVVNTPQGIVSISKQLYLWSLRNWTLKSNQPLGPGSTVTRACSYGYDPRTSATAVSNMAWLADWDGSATSGRSTLSRNHRGGQNVLYLDGSVRWQATNYCSDNPMDDIFIEGGIGKNGMTVYWNADTDVYLVNAPTVLGASYNGYLSLQE